MKVSALSLFAGLFFVLGSPAFSADITITGNEEVTGSADWTFYATPLDSGATYTWSVDAGTIVAQNTNPAAGPLYVTIRWVSTWLFQDYIQISDNKGNLGSFWVYVCGPCLQQNPFASFATRDMHKEGANVGASRMYKWFEAVLDE